MPGFFGHRLLLDLKVGGIRLLLRKPTVDPHLLVKANIQTFHDLQISWEGGGDADTGGRVFLRRFAFVLELLTALDLRSSWVYLYRQGIASHDWSAGLVFWLGAIVSDWERWFRTWIHGFWLGTLVSDDCLPWTSVTRDNDHQATFTPLPC